MQKGRSPSGSGRECRTGENAASCGPGIRTAFCTAEQPFCATRRSTGCGGCYARAGSLGAGWPTWVAKGFPDALGSRCADVLVDRQGLTQTVKAYVVVAVLDVGPAESF